MPCDFDITESLWFKEGQNSIWFNEGEKRGQENFLSGPLADFFGPLPEPVQERIARASKEQLRVWARGSGRLVAWTKFSLADRPGTPLVSVPGGASFRSTRRALYSVEINCR